MVVITLPMREIVPVKELPDGLGRLFNDSCRGRLTIRIFAETLFVFLVERGTTETRKHIYKLRTQFE